MLKKVVLTVLISSAFCMQSAADNNWAVSVNAGVTGSQDYLNNEIYKNNANSYPTHDDYAPYTADFGIQVYFPFNLPIPNLSYYVKYEGSGYSVFYYNYYSNGVAAKEFHEDVMFGYAGILGLEYTAFNFSEWSLYAAGDVGIMMFTGNIRVVLREAFGAVTSSKQSGPPGLQFGYSAALGAKKSFGDNFFLGLEGGYSTLGPILKGIIGWTFTDDNGAKRKEVF